MDSTSCEARNGEAVRQAIELGEMAHIETASEELTDEFLLFAIDSGLLKSWAGSFSDPRCEPEIGMEVILLAHIAARFRLPVLDAQSRVCATLCAGVRGVGLRYGSSQPECGLSLRGTADDKLFSGDVVRKLLVQMEQQADLSQRWCGGSPGAQCGAVKVRERASRRAVKHAVDEAEAEAQAHQSATQLVGWYNQLLGYRC